MFILNHPSIMCFSAFLAAFCISHVLNALCFQERRQSGVVTIMSSETGVGKTKLLTVYHDLISCKATANDARMAALLGVLQDYAGQHKSLLVQSLADSLRRYGLALSERFRESTRYSAPQPQQEPEGAVTAMLKQLRENGPDAIGLHRLICCMMAGICSQPAHDAVPALDGLLNKLEAFFKEQLLTDMLLDTQQLAYVLQHFDRDAPWDTAVDRVTAACQAYKLSDDPFHTRSLSSFIQTFLEESSCTGAQALAEAESNFGGARKLLLLVLASLSVDRCSTFQAMQMHAQITTAALRSQLLPLIDTAARCPDEKFTFFVDELNTSSIMGEMKSLFVDGMFDGQRVPSNIFLVAAINPAKPRVESPRAHEHALFDSRYIVRPCPASMEEAVWAFGSMSALQEKDYVTAKLQMLAAEGADAPELDRDQARLLMRFISMSQVRLHMCCNVCIMFPAACMFLS